MSLRPSLALAASVALILAACGGGSQTTLGAGTGGTSATGGYSNQAGDTGAGGSSADGGSDGSGGNESTGGQSSGNQVCTPFDTGVCTGAGACVGGRECAADGMGWSPCDCGLATGGSTSGTGGAPGTGGLVGNTGGASPVGGTGGIFGVTGGASTGGAATGGTSTGGAPSTGGSATGGVSTGGSTTGGASSTGGASTGGSSGSTDTCESAPAWNVWKDSAGAMGDRVRFTCTSLQLGCAGKQAGVEYLFSCNQSHVPNCQMQNPQTGTSWAFVAECAPPTDCNETLPYQPYSWDASEVYATAVCNGSYACVGATTGLTYKFECTDTYNCETQDPGSTNWFTPPWKRVGLCTY